MKYDSEYFRIELLNLKNCDFSQYRDYSTFDVLLHKIKTEEICNYLDVDWLAFKDNIACLINENFNCRVLLSTMVKIKFLLYIQRYAHAMWNKPDRAERIESDCARLISYFIEQDSNNEYHGVYKYMPRIDLRRWLQYPHIFFEITPLKLFENSKQDIQERGIQIITELFNDYIDYLEPYDIERFQFISQQNLSSNTNPHNQSQNSAIQEEMAQLKLRHSKMHEEYANLQANFSGKVAIIEGQEKMIAELQTENKQLKEDLYYLKKEMRLGQNSCVVVTDNSIQMTESADNEPTISSQISLEPLVKKDTNSKIQDKLHNELTPLIHENFPAKVCDVLLEYKEYLSISIKLAPAIYDMLEKIYGKIRFAKASFSRAMNRKLNKK